MYEMDMEGTIHIDNLLVGTEDLHIYVYIDICVSR